MIILQVIVPDELGNKGYDMAQLLEWVLQEGVVQGLEQFVHIDQLDQLQKCVLLIFYLCWAELNRT